MSQAGSKHTLLQERLGYKFQDRSKLEEALRHPSLSGSLDNQRYEFLGDRVLGLVIAEELLQRDPNAKEGELAPRFNHLVRKETCAQIAEHLRLGDEIKLGRSESMSGGRRKIALLGDVIEAMIAAIYLDGGYDAAKAFILKNWDAKIRAVPDDAVDPKTRLQEFVQKRKNQPPTYVLLSREGPDHAPVFTVEVSALQMSASATGNSKRTAESKAAGILFDKLTGGHK